MSLHFITLVRVNALRFYLACQGDSLAFLNHFSGRMSCISKITCPGGYLCIPYPLYNACIHITVYSYYAISGARMLLRRNIRGVNISSSGSEVFVSTVFVNIVSGAQARSNPPPPSPPQPHTSCRNKPHAPRSDPARTNQTPTDKPSATDRLPPSA